jgi:hypothetical protein
MDTFNNQVLYEFIEQENRPVSLFDLITHFESVPEMEIFGCITSLKEAGWIEEVRRFTWDITEKAIAQSKDVAEGERQQRIHRASEQVQTKAELKDAKKMLKHYPATKFMVKAIFVISLGLVGLILRKWIKE